MRQLLDNEVDEKNRAEAECARLKKVAEDHRKEREQWKKDLQATQAELDQLKQAQDNEKKLLAERDQEIARVADERDRIKQEAAQMIDQMKASMDNTSKYENYVDKSVIGSFLVNFFESSSNPKVQLELLSTLSKLLSFTADQQAKIGVQETKLKKMAESQPQPSPEGKKSFSASFINFLTSSE